MANTIQIRRSSTASATPTAGQLSAGELAINTADGRLFAKNSAGTVVNLPVTSISGQTITPGQVDVDNIRLDANTISSIDTDGNLIVAPNGAGKVLLGRTTPDNTTNVVQVDSLTINGSDNVGSGINPTLTARGLTFFGAQAGDVGIGCWKIPANTFGTHADAFSFNGVNEAATQYTPIMFTTGYFAQLWLGTGGNVGVGMTAPGSRLVIKGGNTTSAGSALNVTNSSNTSILFARNDGNVGIGVTAPTQKLEVNGAIKAAQVDIGTSNVLDAAATHACVIGGLQSKASLYGEIAHASGGFVSTEGTAQHRILVARGLTLSGAFTVSIASPAVFTRNGHSLSVGDTVKLSTTGALPTGLNTTANYYVISAGLTANTFQVSTTPGGSAVVTSGTQSGTHTLIPTTSLTLNGAGGLQTPARLVIPERSTWSFTLKLSAYSSQNNQGGAWWLNGGLRRNLTTTVELENVQGFQYAEASFGASGALIDIAADTTNNALDIRVTGIANQSVRWAAVVDIIQASYGTP